MHRFDLLGAQAGDLQHLDQAGRDRGLQVIVVGQFAGADEVGDLFLYAFADAFDFGEAIFGDEFLEGLGEPLEGARGIFVGAGLEWVLALELEQPADFNQNLRHPVFVHDLEYGV